MVEESFDQPWVGNRVRLLEQGIFRAGKCWSLRNTSGLSDEDNGMHEDSLLASARTMTRCAPVLVNHMCVPSFPDTACFTVKAQFFQVTSFE